MEFFDVLEKDCADPAFQDAFRAYFGELGVKVTNWDGLFAEISQAPDCAFVRRDGQGRIVGFLLMASQEMTSGFFTTRIGCMEEFYVAPEYRRQGHGMALLAMAEEHLSKAGCPYAILTTQTAAAFYMKRGYRLQRGISARNKADVYVKSLWV
ncbi:MAG: GNAT family N-acetyltransferase [Clostridia bacterium]|nr:GNAT family N-acetyltransferase [Clostridia bacterium]